MTSDEVRKKYIEFFKSSPRNHKEIAPSPLVLKDDPTTLFTSAGMQQLVPYLSGERKHPEGKRLVNSQPSFRAVDIEEVGDNRHTTFFEMLGNWSLGDYFKKEQIPWVWEFLTEELGLPKEKLYITVFEGGDGVSKDTESYEAWKSLGVPEEKIFFYGVDKNWWSRAGTPKEMPVGEIGGPDTEVFFEFDSLEHNPKYGKECHPNCECGRFVEIANSVFIQYIKNENGLGELPQKNVDFGGGLERLVAATNNTPDIFETDLFKPVVKEIEEVSGQNYRGNEAYMRRIADHIKAASFIIAEGIKPFKESHGSVLRRLIRKSIDSARAIGIKHSIVSTFSRGVVNIYRDAYPTLFNKSDQIIQELSVEEERYIKETLSENILSKVENLQKNLPAEKYPGLNTVKLSGTVAYTSLASQGIPIELSFGYAREAGTLSTQEEEAEWWKTVEEERNKHREISRQGATQKFGKGNK